MPRIIINEIDETVAGESVTDVDIAYIPGFAATNTNCYIFTEIGAAPTTATAGDIWDAGDTYRIGISSCPRWTPSAPAASATSTRSSIMSSTPKRSATGRHFTASS